MIFVGFYSLAALFAFDLQSSADRILDLRPITSAGTSYVPRTHSATPGDQWDNTHMSLGNTSIHCIDYGLYFTQSRADMMTGRGGDYLTPFKLIWSMFDLLLSRRKSQTLERWVFPYQSLRLKSSSAFNSSGKVRDVEKSYRYRVFLSLVPKRYLARNIFLTGVFSLLLCVFIDGNYLTFVCKMRSWFPAGSTLDRILSHTGAIDSYSFRGKNIKFDAPVAAKLHHSHQTWSVCRMHRQRRALW